MVCGCWSEECIYFYSYQKFCSLGTYHRILLQSCPRTCPVLCLKIVQRDLDQLHIPQNIIMVLSIDDILPLWLVKQKKKKNNLEYFQCQDSRTGTSLVAQWLRVCLPMQGTRVQALVQEDPTCRGATKPVCHNYWACALELVSHNYWACVPQLRKPTCLEPVLCNKRSHHNEKPAHRNEEYPLLAATRESLCAAAKTHTAKKKKTHVLQKAGDKPYENLRDCHK